MLLGAYVVQTGGTRCAWEPFVASLPIALLVALILYVNEIPDRRGDARAGKRTLPVRFSQRHGHRRLPASRPRRRTRSLVVGVVARASCRSRRCSMLLTIPLALQVSRGLEPNYDNPYGLMAIMGVNIKVHLYAGSAADRGLPRRPRERRAGAVGRPVPRLGWRGHAC